MQAKLIYKKLDEDFIKPGLNDDWINYMDEIKDFLCENFKKREIGLVCDFTDEIKKVYTAVFPSDKVMKKILNDKIKNAMLFVHHPSIWDIRRAPEIFYQMNRKLLEEFKKRKISIYALHVPLDNFGKYSTSVTLAEALNIKIEKPCSPYSGSLSGAIGISPCEKVQELKEIFAKAVGHEVKLYNYGSDLIKDRKVAVLAGGGNHLDYLKDVFKEGVKTIITGVSVRNEFSEKNPCL